MRLRFIIIFIIAAALFFPLNVFAENIDLSGTSRDERLAKAVSDQQVVLDDATRAATITKCQLAQTKLRTIQNGTDNLIQERINTYSYIQKELQAIKLRMMRQGADASETDLLTGKIQQALDQFTIQADHYGTALDDVINVDCVQKPEQFRAGLVVMRLQRSELLNQANNLKTILNNADNNIFTPLKKRLTI